LYSGVCSDEARADDVEDVAAVVLPQQRITCAAAGSFRTGQQSWRKRMGMTAVLQQHGDDGYHLHAGGDMQRCLAVVVDDLQQDCHQNTKTGQHWWAGAIRWDCNRAAAAA
jgi:hypothetical protein